jgi:hypothetical protein
MSVYPRRALTEENVLVHTGPRGLRQRYDSPSLSKKSLGHVKGVYVGFVPSAAGSVLTLSPDPVEGHSTLKVPSRLDHAGVDLIVTTPIAIDFVASLAGELLPDGVNVKAQALYSETGQATAQIVTETRTVNPIVHTVAASPAALDLTTLAPLGALVPGSLTFNLNVDGVGPDTITDDGNGNLVGTALDGAAVVDYKSGTFIGDTSALTALSNVMLLHTRCSGPDEVMICVVTGAPGAIAVNTTPPVYGAPTLRDVPIAFPGCTIPYGYLEAGAVEDLEAAVEILNEVIAARTDLQGTLHPNLKSRLDTDLGAPAMSLRLGKTMRALRGNTTSVLAGVTEVNVSSSFGEFSREHEPKLTLNGGGDESTIGAVTDSPRNVVFVTNDEDGDRLHDNETDRNVVIGRLDQEADFPLDGVISFTNAIATVVGDTDAAFTSQVEIGDLLQGADGRFYEVQSVDSATQITLVTAYQGANASSGGLLRRRLLLRFWTSGAGGTEDAHAIESSQDVNFAFAAFMGIGTPSFDAFNFMHAPGERNPVPTATTFVPGKVELASAGSPFAGSLLLQQRNVAVAGGPFHTLNFSAGSIIELSEGVLDVVVIGGTGPDGSGGGLGDPGPPGNDGPDLDLIATFEPDIERSLPHGAIETHTIDFGFDVAFLSGGIAGVRDGGFISVGEDWILTDMSLAVDGRTGSVTVENPLGGLGGDQFVTLYLDACGFS